MTIHANRIANAALEAWKRSKSPSSVEALVKLTCAKAVLAERKAIVVYLRTLFDEEPDGAVTLETLSGLISERDAPHLWTERGGSDGHGAP